MTSAAAICAANLESARARKEKLRAEFPECYEIVGYLKKAGFENFRVVKMAEAGRTWQR